MIRLLILLGLLLPAAAQAQQVVLVAWEPAPTQPMDELVAAVQVSLAELRLPVVGVEQPGLDVAAARQLARELHAHTVVWLSPDHSEVLLLSPALDADPVRRPLTEVQGSWGATCAAVATITEHEVLAAIEAVNRVPEPAPPPPEAVPEPELNPTGAASILAPPAAPASGSLRLGYTPVPLSEGGQVLHGVELAGGVRFGRFVGVEFGASITTAAVLEESAAASRLPLRLVAVGTLPLRVVDLSLGLGVGVELVQPVVSGTLVDSSVGELQASPLFVGSVRVAARVTPWFAPFALIGLDATADALEFTRHDELVARRDAVVLHASFGIQLTAPFWPPARVQGAAQ